MQYISQVIKEKNNFVTAPFNEKEVKEMVSRGTTGSVGIILELIMTLGTVSNANEKCIRQGYPISCIHYFNTMVDMLSILVKR